MLGPSRKLPWLREDGKRGTYATRDYDVRTGSGRRTWPSRVHTLVIGSGAAGLNAANQLRAMGIEDVLVVTEGLQMGTSINTGSDKQTY